MVSIYSYGLVRTTLDLQVGQVGQRLGVALAVIHSLSLPTPQGGVKKGRSSKPYGAVRAMMRASREGLHWRLLDHRARFLTES